VLGLCAEVDRVYQYDTVKDLFALARKRYDVIIDTEQWHRLSAVVARLLRSDWKIGYQTNERGRLFTHGVDYSHQDYEAFSFWRLLEPIGVSVPEELPSRFLTLPETVGGKVEALLDEYRGRRIVTIFPFASIPERQWDVACFRQVARWCLDQGLAVVMVGGAGDRQTGRELVEGMDVLNLVGQVSLVETAAVMEQSALILSGDSGPLHIAVGLDRPTVSLFGPGISDKWAPRGTKHVVLNKQLSCSPCTRFGTTPPCPIGVQCMKQIAAQDVILAIDGLLST
jgi:ADP-heptose:LPS heptosyltransferase